MGRAGSLLLDIEFKKFIHSADASDKMGTYYIFSDFIKEITVHLVYKKKVMPENIYKINDKTLSSLAWNDIKIHGGKRFMQFATSRLEREILAGFFVEDTRNVGNLLLNNGFIGYFLRSFFNNV